MRKALPPWAHSLREMTRDETGNRTPHDFFSSWRTCQLQSGCRLISSPS